MFRAVGSVLKRNKESFYGIARGSTSSSHRAFTCNVTSSTTVNPASSSPLAGNSFNGLRSLLKGQKAPIFRKMSTLAAASSESKEGLKLLVTGGPQARKWVGTWLFGSAAWVFSMVVLGGVTRLTRSGLSMTDWKFTGEFPPLSDDAWAKEFEKYKQSPEYKRVNKGMNLEDFKFIYWMEYAHRMWGRGLGIMFALPFSYFLRKGYITLRLGVQLSGLFALGAGQGFIGWWMVKSGLEEPPSEYSQPRKLPVGGRLKQKRELANLGNMQVKEAEKSNKCKKRKVDTDYDDDSEASGTSSLVPEFTLNQKEIIRPGVPKMFAEMHMPKEETVFKIHDPKRNKSWSVVSKIQSRFSRGWPGLVKDFGLKVGDVCTFELIKPTEMILTVDSM
ncbi:hypothetical protein DY000_02017348 [Brassica cretica]|uniref:TF-B3 domain-containing protein n=1 Tax=Brassica cretica TaxID=69181 RepID=A0ABQ7D158_BRACR|nr:hypothetical protein DY000_02017348 [Brassica cretica]